MLQCWLQDLRCSVSLGRFCSCGSWSTGLRHGQFHVLSLLLNIFVFFNLCLFALCYQPPTVGPGASMMQPIMGQPMMGQPMMRAPFTGMAGAAPGAAAPGAPVTMSTGIEPSFPWYKMFRLYAFMFHWTFCFLFLGFFWTSKSEPQEAQGPTGGSRPQGLLITPQVGAQRSECRPDDLSPGLIKLKMQSDWELWAQVCFCTRSEQTEDSWSRRYLFTVVQIHIFECNLIFASYKVTSPQMQ